jgi:hypothetical protein
MNGTLSHEPLVTLEFQRFPRSGVLGELARHRCASLSVESDRAVPSDKVLQQILQDPFVPIDLRRNGRGMESQVRFEGATLRQAQLQWLKCRDVALREATDLMAQGVHKQTVNRVLEPWRRVNLVMSTTLLGSILTLRMAPDVQPEFQRIARNIVTAVSGRKSGSIVPQEWTELRSVHLPYVTPVDFATIETPRDALIHSVARCARATYGRNGIVASLAEDAALVLRLQSEESPREYECAGWCNVRQEYVSRIATTDECIHASPMEHVALPDRCANLGTGGNFGARWSQLRHNEPLRQYVLSRARDIVARGAK